MALKIRLAAKKDADALVGLWQQLHLFTVKISFHPHDFAYISNPKGLMKKEITKAIARKLAYIAVDGEKAAGCMVLKPVESKPLYLKRKHLEVLRLYVLPEYRKFGLGKKFMDLAEKVARQRKADSLTLDTHSSNTNAIAFYGHLGFHKTVVHMKKYLGK